MLQNMTLKIKIIASGMRQVDVARKIDIHEERFSQFICVRRTPNPEEKTKIAAILGCSPGELFPE